MSQPVKLSDALVLEARLAGQAQQRSIAGQVEFWARLGRSVEELLDGSELRTLRKMAEQRPLSELVEAIGKPEGRARLRAHLDSEPYPHFEPHPARKGWLVRIDEDGRRTAGRFVNRQFVIDGGFVRHPGKVDVAEKAAGLERIKISGRPSAGASGPHKSRPSKLLSGTTDSGQRRSTSRTSKSTRA